MRVLHVVGYIPIGGVGTFIKNLIANSDSDIEYTVLAIDKIQESPFRDDIMKLGAKFIYLNLRLSPLNLFAIRSKVSNFLINNKFDIIHVHSPNIALFLGTKIYDSKTIIHSHSTYYSTSFVKEIRNLILFKTINRYDFRFACSNEAGNFLFNKKDFKLIPNGINIELYSFDETKRNAIRNTNKKIIGFVGNLLEQKNPFFLIDVFEQLLKTDNKYELWIIGDGPLKGKLIDTINKKGIQNNVKLFGNVNNVYDLYHAMDIFLLPSYYEGFGIVILEAQASNLPCIISANCPKSVSINSNCYTLDISDNREWVDKILSIDVNVDNRKKELSNDILQYDIKQTAKQIVDYYRGIL